jgi:DNA-binding IclR family transcriptional regulator
MSRPRSKRPVKMSILAILGRGPKRFSELVKESKRPDKTVYVTLKELVAMRLVSRNEQGEYVVTERGRRELDRMRLVRAVEREGDPEILASLTDLYFRLSRFKPKPRSAP